MPTPSTLALFSASALVLLLVPGPAVLYIVTRSIEHGRRAGLVSVAGIHTGSVVHVVSAAVGISALLATSATAFTAVKLLGAAYLVLLGLKRLVQRSAETDATSSDAQMSLRRTYGQGVVVNILNLKTALFFLAFLPQFVNPNRGPIWVQFLILGCCFIGIGLCTDSAYATVAGALGNRMRSSKDVLRKTHRLSGITYIGLGITAAATGHAVRRTAA